MIKIFFLLAFTLVVPASIHAQQRNAFIDPNTGVLTAVGFVDKNAPGEIKIAVAADFKLAPGEWRWDGKTWVAVPPAADPRLAELQDLAFSIDNAIRSPLLSADLKDVLLKLKKVLANGQ